jgi:hypothetical protein
MVMNPETVTTTPEEESSDALQLIDRVGEFYADPLGFVLACFRWGEPGTELEHFHGPDEWQRQELWEI